MFYPLLLHLFQTKVQMEPNVGITFILSRCSSSYCDRKGWRDWTCCFPEQIMLHCSVPCHDTWQLSCITIWNCSHVSHSFFEEDICFFGRPFVSLERPLHPWFKLIFLLKSLQLICNLWNLIVFQWKHVFISIV